MDRLSFIYVCLHSFLCVLIVSNWRAGALQDGVTACLEAALRQSSSKSSGDAGGPWLACRFGGNGIQSLPTPLYMYLCVCIYVCMHVCTYVYVCIYEYMYVYVCRCMCISIHIYIYIVIYPYIHICACICMLNIALPVQPVEHSTRKGNNSVEAMSHLLWTLDCAWCRAATASQEFSSFVPHTERA